MGCVFGGEGTIVLNLPRCVGGVSVCVCVLQVGEDAKLYYSWV